ncbi:MAG TPA: beta-ketoacyl-ACP synthase III [Nitriliruptorales bacterium]|nr:beta-ketoacyl-ACP synthase III [Nitriliruptorales bacterium]
MSTGGGVVDALTVPSHPTTGRVLPVDVAGIGVALPEEVVTNDDWAAVLDTSDEWIVSRTGIRERRRADPGQATSDLAVDAAVAALADAGVDAADLAAVVLATTTPDHVIPQTAPLVAARLGSEAAAFDVGAGCSGFVYGLAVAAGMAVGLLPGPVLVIGAETLTRWIDRAERDTAVLFGDGAGAFVLRPGAGALGPFDLGCDGSLADIVFVPAGGSRRPPGATVAARDLTLRMEGRAVYRQAVRRMVSSSQAVLESAGLGVQDVDLLVGHQANARILEAVAGRLGIGEERAFICVDRYGNTSAASIPLALHEARTQGRVRDGDRVLLTAFGAGLTWGSCLLVWGGHPGERARHRDRTAGVTPTTDRLGSRPPVSRG